MNFKLNYVSGLPVLAFSLVHAAAFAQATPVPSADAASASTGAASAADAIRPGATSTLTVQQVVVTAERRTQDLQKTAVSITVIDGQTLAQQNKTDVASIIQGVPGVVFQAIKPDGDPVISMRGVGTDNPLGNPGVALYLDGITMKQAAFQFFDMDRVEVLRGPQGTLYGRGAPAGAVNFITRDPTNKLGAEGTIGIGNYGLYDVTAIGNIPIGDMLAVRMGVNAEKRNGYFDNRLSDSDQTNARIKLKFQPTKTFSLVLGYDTYWNRSKGAGEVNLNADNSIPGYVSDAPTTDGLGVHDEFHKFNANMNWDLGAVTLTYLGSFQNYSEDSATYFGGNSNHALEKPDLARTHEIRVSSNGRDALSWIVGVYAQDTTLDAVTGIQNGLFSGSFSNLTNTTSRALFAEATYALTQDWRFTLGGRRSDDTYKSNLPQTFNFLVPPPPGGFPNLNFDSVPASNKFNHTDYKARVEKAFGPNSMAYATISTGYRPGGAAGNGDGTTQQYGIEVNRAVELGTKNRFLDGRLQLNAEVFRYEYSGFQQAFQASGSPFVSILSHPARFFGGEVEGKAALTTNDQLSLNVSLLSARYLDVSLPVPHSPHSTLGLGYEHDFDLPNGGTLRMGGDATYQTRTYTNYSATVDPGMLQPAYTIGNLSLGYESPDDKFTVTGYIHNVGDKLYKLSVNQVQGGADTAAISPPRTAGLVFGWRL